MADTLAFRKSIGLLIPYFNSVVQPEMDGLRPSGVTNQTARFSLDENVLEDIAQAAEKLATSGIHALVVALSTESFAGGLALAEQSAGDIQRRTGLPVVTASHAVLAALRAIGARRISVVTPFDEAANEQVKISFADSGFEVAGIDGLACPDITKIGHSDLEAVRKSFQAADRDDADALVHVGSGLPVVGIVEELERRHEKPVVACNAASYWQALREVGIDDRFPGRGRLFHEH